ncbi:Kelch repeat-containing protein [Mucilaginibacter segetis]|uniref:Galactose oxidase n=1 Tax=Mucilaginibacter segetis TaxID=2793071 RepID=A0A934PT33_9SPHI|nr:hypothetical protein [Mucilaginibacter segetis]MBK0379544.1 hypothetical protein [Mucilaginibacter segetis]
MKPYHIIYFMFLAVVLLSCKKQPFNPPTKNGIPGLWKQLGDFTGGGRARAFGFTIGSKGYILGGHATQDAGFAYLSDFWEYDPATDKWTRKADYPGQASEYIKGFSINNKGYVGTGYGIKGLTNGNSPQTVEFYEYDPATDKWTRKADFGGVERENTVAFEINGFGYMGLGTDYNYEADYKDLWKYDVSADRWTRVADYPGGGSFGNVGFACNGKGYVGLGGSNINKLNSDFWQYDPGTDKWVQKANFIGTPRVFSGQFVIGNKAFVCFGESATSPLGDSYKYNSLTDTWTKNTNFEGSPRSDLVSFAIDGIGYIGTGNRGGYADFWKFTPNKLLDD